MKFHCISVENTVYITFALSLISVFVILNGQLSFSQNPEVSFLDVNSTSSLSKFSVAAWFKTSADFSSNAFIVNKAGESGNLNYGIWMTSAENVRGGFETSSGRQIYATSPLSYSDGKWHYAVVTFDGSLVSLYVDGLQVASKKTSASPDNDGEEPVRVGANSEAPGNYFDGDVDEIRVWNVALTTEEVYAAYHDTFDTRNQVLYLDFSEPLVPANVTNQTALNQTALNQTALNQTALNQTALNQTALNQTVVLDVNGTLDNGSSILGQPITNGTLNENLTSEILLEENSSPDASDQSVSLDQDTQVDIVLDANDQDNDSLQFNITADPLQGALENFDKEKGTLTYVPQQGFSGNDEFKFNAIDNKGAESNIALVDITVNKTIQFNETQETPLTNTTDTGISNETTDTGISNETTETGISNETLGNQTSEIVTEENNSPEAFDQSVKLNQNDQIGINLLATDEDGDPLQFDITADPLHGALENFDKEKGTLTYVPQQGFSGNDEFKFNAIDNKGAGSNIALVDVTVNEISQSNESQVNGLAESKVDNQTGSELSTELGTTDQPNQIPNANAGDDQQAEVNTEVKLDGSKSFDEDGEIVSYKWEQTDGPEVDLKQSDEQTASFDVPESAADSKLTFKLTVSDDENESSSDDVTVEVQNVEVSSAQQTDNTQQQTDNTQQQTETNEQATVEDQVEENASPKAEAGDDQQAEVNTEVKLDGSKSFDEDGEIVSYKWEQTDGPEVDLKQSDEQTASFDVPESAADSKLTFKLTVVDDNDASSSDDVTIEIEKITDNNSDTENTDNNSKGKNK